MIFSTQLPCILGRQMNPDPFENFERSRAGWSIPLALLVLGGGLTYLAINSLHGILLREVDAPRAAQAEKGGPAEAGQGGELQAGNPHVAVENGKLEEAEAEGSATGASGQK